MLILIFKPQKKISTSENTSSDNEILNVTTITESNIKIDLPEEIKDTSTQKNTNSSNSTKTSTENNKTYEPITDSSEKYFIPVLSNNEVTILIGEDSASLLSSTSPVEVGHEYKVTGIEETIVSVYYFSIDGYSYPILLLLSETGKLYYVDIESAYLTGNFEIAGYIKDLPEVDNVYQATVTENGKQYRSAVIKDIDGVGYEFNTSMIDR